MSGSSFQYKNFADTTLLTIANDGSTTFAGELSTPSFNSTGINETIEYIQTDITNLNTLFNSTGSDIANIQTEITTGINPNISNLQSDLSAVQTDITDFIKPDILKTQTDILTLQANNEPHGFENLTDTSFATDTVSGNFYIGLPNGSANIYYKGQK